MFLFYSGWLPIFLATLVHQLGLWPELVSLAVATGSLILFAGLVRHLFGVRWNPFYIVPALTIIWYAFPMTYIDASAISSYSTITNEQAWAAVYSIVLICGVGPIIGAVFPGLGIDVPKYLTGINIYNSVLTLTIICIAQIYAIYTGYWNFGVISLYASRVESSQITLVIAFVARPMMLSAAVVLANIIRRRPNGYMFMLLCMILVVFVQFIWLSIEGRRIVSVNLIVSAILFIRFFHARENIRLKHIMIYGISAIGVGFVTIVSWAIYFFLRQANYAANLSNMNIIEMVTFAINRADAYSAQAGANFASRPFLLVESFGYVTGAAKGITYGGGLLSSALQAVPAVFWPGKASSVAPDIEHVWTSMLNIRLFDWSNTLILEGFVDFGPMGLYVHIGLMTLFAKAVEAVAKRTESALFFVFCIGSFVTLCASVEVSATEYFVWGRNLLAFGSLLVLMRSLFGNQSRITVSERSDMFQR